MKASDLSGDRWGRLVRVAGGYEAFIPRSLPPPLEATWALTSALSRADRALAELAGAARALPNPQVLVAPFVRREAVLSSQIEGTQASLSDLFFFESGPAFAKSPGAGPPEDVREVSNYVTALDYGLAPDERCDEDLRIRQRAGSPGQLGERAIGARKSRSQGPGGLQGRRQRPRDKGLVASRDAHEPAPAVA